MILIMMMYFSDVSGTHSQKMLTRFHRFFGYFHYCHKELDFKKKKNFLVSIIYHTINEKNTKNGPIAFALKKQHLETPKLLIYDPVNPITPICPSFFNFYGNHAILIAIYEVFYLFYS